MVLHLRFLTPLVATLLMAPVMADAQTRSLVANGDFEGEGHWTPNWSWSGANSNLQIVRDPAQALEGRAALRVTARNEKVTQFNSNQFTLKEGRAYKVSFQYRGEGVGPVNATVRLAPPPWTPYFATTVNPVLEWNRAEFIGLSPVTRDEAALIFAFEGPGTLWLDDVQVTEIELPQGTPRNFDNLLQNSSFEVPPHYDDWILGNEIADGQWQLDTTTCVDGRSSLRFARALRDTNLLDFRSGDLRLQQNTEHTLSAFLRSDRPRHVTLALRSGAATLFRQTFEVGTEWKRYEVSGNSRLGDDYFVTIGSNSGPLWLDGLYLCEGSKAPEYKPMHPVEAAANVDTVSKTFQQGEAVPVTVTVRNHGGGKSRVNWYLTDWQGRRMPGLGGTQETEGPFKAIQLKITPPQFGLFQFVAEPEAGAPAHAVFAYLAKPRLVEAEQSRFGGHFRLRQPEISMMKKLGVHWARAHWPPVWTQWRAVEPQKGQWKFADDTMQLARQEGIEILGNIATTPPWAAPEGKGVIGGGYPMTYPANLEDWRNYVRQVVTHYPRITAWEIFNEPHVSTFWSGDHEQLMTLYAEAAKIIKEINPDLKVVGWPVPSLEELQQHGILRYVDALSEHQYGHGRTVDQRVDEFNAQFAARRQQLAALGQARIALWDTEYGPGNWGSLRRSRDTKDQRRAVEYMLKHTVVQISQGFQKFFPYLFVPGSGTGHIAMDEDFAPRTGLVAYATVARFTDGAEPLGELKLKDSKLRAFRFRRDGQEIVFVWSREAGYTVDLGQKWPPGVEVFDEMGNMLSTPVKLELMPRIFTGPEAGLKAMFN